MALVLSRKLYEAILIGDDICVTVTDISRDGTQVKIAVSAPREVAVDRSEVRLRKEQEREASILPTQEQP